MIPDITEYDIKDIIYVIIGCDGLYDAFNEQEIFDIITIKPSKKKIEKLFDSAVSNDINNSKTTDNISLIYIKIN